MRRLRGLLLVDWQLCGRRGAGEELLRSRCSFGVSFLKQFAINCELTKESFFFFFFFLKKKRLTGIV